MKRIYFKSGVKTAAGCRSSTCSVGTSGSRHVTLIEPDVYKPHNVERHLFPWSAVGETKAALAEDWHFHERRPDLAVDLLVCDLMDPAHQEEINQAAAGADIGVCAADNEPAKFHWDALMRRHAKPWTLGEVLSGGIGGFVHWFTPGGPCYGCVAGHLQRNVVLDNSPPPDYSNPGAAVTETTIPASAWRPSTPSLLSTPLVTLGLLTDPAGYAARALRVCCLLFSREAPQVFEE